MDTTQITRAQIDDYANKLGFDVRESVATGYHNYIEFQIRFKNGTRIFLDITQTRLLLEALYDAKLRAERD